MTDKKRDRRPGLTALTTPWSDQVDRACPLNDYPRPQMRRQDWQCLNGPWQYAIRIHEARPSHWDGEILVPYSPESLLSGVERQLLPGQTLWYRRRVIWKALGEQERRLLHFGGVDQRCTVYVNGVQVGDHTGGYWPFTFDVTEVAQPGSNLIEVSVQDESDQGIEAYGKQKLDRGKIWYTAQSGIWQTVWSEVVPAVYISNLQIEPRLISETLLVTITSSEPDRLMEGDVSVYDGDRLVGVADLRGNKAQIHLPGARRWTPEDPFLYIITVRAGQDQVDSYAGMREFGQGLTKGGTPYLTLNGEPVFHNGLLDQGYWSDGLYTPPTDVAMAEELEALKSLGYNMVRKHIKIEPLRWYYHCDRIGLLVWQDFVSGGGPYKPWVVQVAPFLGRNYSDGPDRYAMFGRQSTEGRQAFRRDMRRTVELLRHVVSLAVWVPFNEGWGQFNAAAIANEVKGLDDSRLVDHASGYFDQGAGDFHSFHVYFKHFNPKPDLAHRSDQPPRILALTEFGGYSLATPGHMASPDEFGYKVMRDAKELDRALAELFERDVVAQIPRGLAATVYTQVSDVEDEINGLFTYDRQLLKPDADRLRAVNRRIYEAFDRFVGSGA